MQFSDSANFHLCDLNEILITFHKNVVRASYYTRQHFYRVLLRALFFCINKMSVDALSDSELRSKLMEYGYPVGPVTQTTRKILVKKLKNLIETRGGTGSRHSLAARYF